MINDGDEIEVKGDFWTKAAAVATFSVEFPSGAYAYSLFTQEILNLIYNSEPAYLNLSIFAISTGVSLALLASGGSTCAHYSLNSSMQDKPKKSASNDKQEEKINEPLIRKPEKDVKLTYTQIAFLLGDAGNDIAKTLGTVEALTNLFDPNSSKWIKIGTRVGGALLGTLQTIPDIRNCAKTMLHQNRLFQQKKSEKININDDCEGIKPSYQSIQTMIMFK